MSTINSRHTLSLRALSVGGVERRHAGDVFSEGAAGELSAPPVTTATTTVKRTTTQTTQMTSKALECGVGGQDIAGEHEPHHPPRTNGLWLTAFYLAFNTMATGVFAVPEAYTSLGIGGGSIAVTIIFGLCWYTMHRLWALRQSHSRAISTFQDLGGFYIGGGFKTFMAVIIYAKIFLGATSEFTLTAALLLRDLTRTEDMPYGYCFVIASAIILAVVLLPGQLRSVHTYSLCESLEESKRAQQHA